MIVYLAGSISGHMVPFWKEYWKLENKGFDSREDQLKRTTLNYLPDHQKDLITELAYDQLADWENIPLLESYYSLEYAGWQLQMIREMNKENFMTLKSSVRSTTPPLCWVLRRTSKT